MVNSFYKITVEDKNGAKTVFHKCKSYRYENESLVIETEDKGNTVIDFQVIGKIFIGLDTLVDQSVGINS